MSFDWLFIIAGLALVGVALADVLTATLVLRGGGGVVSRRLLKVYWLLWLRVTKAQGQLRCYAGVSMMLVILLLWLGGVSLGWGLVFHGLNESFVQPPGPLRFLDHLYVSSSRALGRGGAGFEATLSARWLVLAAGALGVLTISLSISYFVSVVGAVARKRSTANYMRTLGEDTASILERAWDGSGWGNLDLHIVALTAQLLQNCQEHLAYPVIHHYRAPQRNAGFAPNLAVLVRAVHTIEARSLEPLPTSTIRPFLHAVDMLLEAVKSFDDPDDRPIPPEIYEPAEDELEQFGLGDERRLQDAQLKARSRRAAQLRAFCEHEGWDWPVEEP